MTWACRGAINPVIAVAHGDRLLVQHDNGSLSRTLPNRSPIRRLATLFLQSKTAELSPALTPTGAQFLGITRRSRQELTSSSRQRRAAVHQVPSTSSGPTPPAAPSLVTADRWLSSMAYVI